MEVLPAGGQGALPGGGGFLQNKVALLRPQLPAARARRLAATGAERRAAGAQPGTGPRAGSGGGGSGTLVPLYPAEEGFLGRTRGFKGLFELSAGVAAPGCRAAGTGSALPRVRSPGCSAYPAVAALRETRVSDGA